MIETAQTRGRATPESLERVEVLGVPIDALDMRTTVARCLELVESGTPSRHVSVNAAKLASSSRDENLAGFIRGSDVISADGQSVVWAARLLGRPVPERVAGIDLMHELIEAAQRRGLSVYLLGARPEVLGRAVARLRELYPRLRLAGWRDGYFSPEEEESVVEGIRAARPDLLFVAMSSPLKEAWLDRNLDRSRVRFAMGVGGALDVLAGERSRAPAWMQRAGLEWLHRMGQEPGRMWRRYLLGNVRFAWLVLRERLGVTRGSGS
jgi:N-acetylglucosaminyldiphosphoundecaprenol N-acetyl-beta-D-mannosaminyltransferase